MRWRRNLLTGLTPCSGHPDVQGDTKGHRDMQNDSEQSRVMQRDADISRRRQVLTGNRHSMVWPQQKRDILCNVICAAALGQNLHLVHGERLNPGSGQGGAVVQGRWSHAVQEENLYLLIHVAINQQSWAAAFACRMYREESIRKA